MPVTIQDAYVIAREATVSAGAGPVFAFSHVNFYAPPSVTNFGTVSAVASGATESVTGLQDAYAGQNDGAFVRNAVGGSFSLRALGHDGAATGLYTAQGATDFLNEGSFTVVSNNTATGVSSSGGGANFHFVNSGDFEVAGRINSVGVAILGGGEFRNEGLFKVSSETSPATGVLLQGAVFSFYNSGVIEVSDGDSYASSVAVSSAHSGDDKTFINTGSISGDIAFQGAGGFTGITRDILFNSGSMTGRMVLGTGPDILINTGSIHGTVQLGGGDDTFDTSKGETVGVIYGDFGADQIIGSAGDDTIYGGFGTGFNDPLGNRLSGGAGDDRLFGEDGPDSLSGGDGADRLTGGVGSDYLSGGTGADTFLYADWRESPVNAPDYIADLQSGVDKIDLSAVNGPGLAIAYAYGHTFIGFASDTSGAPQGLIAVQGTAFASDLVLGAQVTGVSIFSSDFGERLVGLDGGDALYGAGGADVLIGGGGADRLNGGSGADVFVYSPGDSTVEAADLISDFEHGVDRIELTGAAGGVVNIVHDGAGSSFVYYAPTPDGAGGAILVSGDVEDDDVIADAGTVFIDTGAFAPPPAEPPHEAYHRAAHAGSESGHPSLF